jgi:hypothetical protein
VAAHGTGGHGDLLDVGIDASRTRLTVLDASSRAVGGSVRPLHPVVLVTTKLLGVAAEIVGIGLLRSHVDGLDGWLGR